MAYTPTSIDIQKIRWELQDNAGPGLYIIDDQTIAYFLEKHSGSIARASVDAAKTILFSLSMNSADEQISILSIKGSKAASSYLEALKLFIKDSTLNPMYQNAGAWAGGISKSDIVNNNNNCDNNIPKLSSEHLNPSCYSSSDNPFLI